MSVSTEEQLTTTTATAQLRDLLFIGHATPEDDVFTIWLATQLGGHGYRVWSDKTKLLGGEDFWEDIDALLRHRSTKHLYVLSRHSNHKQGPLKELSVSTSVAKQHAFKDFVIPLRIDDLPHDDIQIELKRLNAIDFSQSWARGLDQLLKKLEEDHVPRTATMTPAHIAAWWREQFSSERGLRVEPEELLTNRFPIAALPKTIYIHSFHQTKTPLLVYPGVFEHHRLVTFASAEDLEGRGIDIITGTIIAPTTVYLAGRNGGATPKQAANNVTRILRLAWEQLARSRQLSPHSMANQNVAFYHRKEKTDGKNIPYRDLEGKQTYRAIVGYKTMPSGNKRYWHFAISAVPRLTPAPAYHIKTHLLFSDDGKTIWSSSAAMQRARARQCRDWWNDDWRDRLLASMQHIASGASSVPLPLRNDTTAQLLVDPLRVISPLAFTDPQKETIPIEEFEEEDETH